MTAWLNFGVRFNLFLLWFVCYCICFAFVMIFWLLNFALLSQIQQYLTQVTGIYAPYLTPIIAFWFAEDIIGKQRPQEPLASTVAFVTSVFFNLTMIVILASIFFAKDREGLIEDTLKLMANTATLLAFVAGPAIGYFFSQVEDRRRGKVVGNRKAAIRTSTGDETNKE
jgi:uncharacterized membrane protein